MLRIGVDLGGTKIEIAAFGTAGRPLLQRRVATPQGDYRGTVAAIAKLVKEIENELGRRGSVGIGTPGAISAATGTIKNANSTCLNGQPLREDLEALLDREIRLANDANCFALSEARDGAGEGAGIVFGVILGTGVGGGIVIDGRVLTGANAIAGEWGHNPLPPTISASRGTDLSATPDNIPDCYCGRKGCIEAWLSGPALCRDYALTAGSKPGNDPGSDPDNNLHSQPTPNVETIVARAGTGETAAIASLERYEARLAQALAQVINILDPEVIVLGGGLSGIARLYENVPHLWQQHIFSDRIVTRLMPPRHGAASGVRGAAWLWSPENEKNG